MHIDYSWLVVLLLLTYILIRDFCSHNYFDLTKKINVALYSGFLVFSSVFIGMYALMLVSFGMILCQSVGKMNLFSLFSLFLLWGGITTWKLFYQKIRN
ncbi:MAG: hypothetical protein VW380_01535 [Candidatus Woesearchaeota archaeon]